MYKYNKYNRYSKKKNSDYYLMLPPAQKTKTLLSCGIYQVSAFFSHTAGLKLHYLIHPINIC